MDDSVRIQRNLMAGAFVLVVLVGAGLWLFARPAPTGNTTGDLAALTARLEALEQQNRDLMAAVARRGPGVSGGRPAGRADLFRQQQQRQHQKRLLEDPAYAKQLQQKRLASLEQMFVSEPVSIQWAPKASIQVEDALASAAKSSGLSNVQGDVDCRTTQCRIRVNVSGDDYDALITYLSVGMTDVLPKASIVTIPRSDGSFDVSIFASTGGKSSRPKDG